MDEEKVDGANAEIVDRGLGGGQQGVSCQFGPPDLGGHEQFVARDSVGADARPDRCFVPIHAGGVDMSIADIDRL